MRAPFALLVASVAAPALVLALDAFVGVGVTIIGKPRSAAEVEEARRLRDPRDDPAEVYGRPEGEPVRVWLLDRSPLVVPVEAPSRRLLPVDRMAGEAPLLARTVTWVAWRAAAGLAALGLLLGAGRALAKRRSKAPAPDDGTPDRAR